MDSAKPLVQVVDLSVDYWQRGSWVNVVDGLDLSVDPAETFGLVGESGSGKSTTANAVLGYRPAGCRYRRGSVWFGGEDLHRLPIANLRKVWGRAISYVPQDPTTALSPGMTAGKQIAEVLLVHDYCSSFRQARDRTLELLSLVSLPDPARIFKKYPYQLSGGQQQRVVIAMALACDPQLIVLDEPTTGLDVTTQAQVLDLLVDLRSRYEMAMVYITHNLGVVAQICTRIGVMYAGRLVEVAPKQLIFHDPRHPYTQGLVASVPRVRTPTRERTVLLRGLLERSELPRGCQFAPRCEFSQKRCYDEAQSLEELVPGHFVACWRREEIPPFGDRVRQSEQSNVHMAAMSAKSDESPLLDVKELRAGYGSGGRKGMLRKAPVIVVDGISFSVREGETMALVGESGSGKTTVARALSGFLPYVTGTLRFATEDDLTQPVGKRSGELLRSLQLVFQNPDASLNPRQRVSTIVGRPLQKFFGVSGRELQRRVERILGDVHLDARYRDLYPDELSGGERQRVAIARALAASPRMLLCDEILSSLDVSVQASILELLVDLQATQKIAYLFISHDLAIVRSLAHQVGVLYWGSLCEIGTVEEVFTPPFHPYTYLLLSSVPEADPEQVLPSARRDIGLLTWEHKTACPFAPRCPWKGDKACADIPPAWQQVSETHYIRCQIPLDELRTHDVWRDRFKQV